MPSTIMACCGCQGTFLTPAKAAALGAMGEHRDLLAAGDAVRGETAHLREARAGIISGRRSFIERGLSFVQRTSDFDAALQVCQEEML